MLLKIVTGAGARAGKKTGAGKKLTGSATRVRCIPNKIVKYRSFYIIRKTHLSTTLFRLKLLKMSFRRELNSYSTGTYQSTTIFAVLRSRSRWSLKLSWGAGAPEPKQCFCKFVRPCYIPVISKNIFTKI